MIMIMREGLFQESMLNNLESWINIAKSDLDILERPNTMVQRSITKTLEIPLKFLGAWNLE